MPRNPSQDLGQGTGTFTDQAIVMKTTGFRQETMAGSLVSCRHTWLGKAGGSLSHWADLGSDGSKDRHLIAG